VEIEGQGASYLNPCALLLFFLENGISPTKIARNLRVSRSTVYATRDRFQQRYDLKSNPRCGRPKKLSRQAIRYIFRMARKHPRMSYRALSANTPGSPSRSTIRRVLKTYGLRKWKSKKRIPLTPEAAKRRRAWVREWAQFSQWERVVFSDECSVQRRSNSKVQHVFRFVSEAYRDDLVNLVNHGKDISQMIWAGIWIGGRSKLIIMERDENAPRRGYTANSYIDALEEGLLPIYEPGTIFQQDNAPIHSADITKEWFENHGIWVIDWPPHSPDLNPIEPVWRLLKLELFRRYPQLGRGRSKLDWDEFKKAICDAWDHLDQNTIDSLIRSLPRRVAAVRAARGWYTRY
jgi:transposase